ncbi:MAG: HPr kinase/phosphatase C-terminal domain-containing protein [Pseudomonadota bacterium]
MDGELIHASAVAIEDRVALIRGPSGSGKSDLALRCLGLATSPLVPAPFRLVADDCVLLAREGDALIARPAPTIAGRLEVRGVGIVAVPHLAEGRVRLVVDLCRASDIDRLPDPAPLATLAGIDLALVRLAPFEASAPLKLALALTRLGGA